MTSMRWWQFRRPMAFFHAADPQQGSIPIVGPETALKHSVVYACAGLLSGAVGRMPILVRSDAVEAEALQRLLNREPDPLFSAHCFWGWIVSSMLLSRTGMGYARIIRDSRGRPITLRACHSDNVEPRIVRGRLRYRLQWHAADANTTVDLDQSDMLAVPGEGYNGVRACSVVRWGAARAIGLQEQMDRAAGDHFSRGALQRLAIVFKSRRSAEQLKAYREGYAAAYGRGTQTRHTPLMLDEDASVVPLTLSAEDSQLLESREFAVDDIARAFRVPSFLINREQKTTSFGSGVTEIAHSFVRFTIAPILARIQGEIERKLVPRHQRWTVEHDTSVLTRAVESERYRAAKTAVGGPWMTINEARQQEGLPPLPDGDVVRR